MKKDERKHLRPRRGSKSTMIDQSIILEKGELFVEYPESGGENFEIKIKMGDGEHIYSDLPYALDLSKYATLDSPTFTGSPKAPTSSATTGTDIVNIDYLQALLNGYAKLTGATFTGEVIGDVSTFNITLFNDYALYKNQYDLNFYFNNFTPYNDLIQYHGYDVNSIAGTDIFSTHSITNGDGKKLATLHWVLHAIEWTLKWFSRHFDYLQNGNDAFNRDTGIASKKYVQNYVSNNVQSVDLTGYVKASDNTTFTGNNTFNNIVVGKNPLKYKDTNSNSYKYETEISSSNINRKDIETSSYSDTNYLMTSRAVYNLISTRELIKPYYTYSINQKTTDYTNTGCVIRVSNGTELYSIDIAKLKEQFDPVYVDKSYSVTINFPSDITSKFAYSDTTNGIYILNLDDIPTESTLIFLTLTFETTGFGSPSSNNMCIDVFGGHSSYNSGISIKDMMTFSNHYFQINTKYMAEPSYYYYQSPYGYFYLYKDILIPYPEQPNSLIFSYRLYQNDTYKTPSDVNYPKISLSMHYTSKKSHYLYRT